VTISTDLGVQDVHYDPYDVVVNADRYPTFARLREEAPLNLVTSQAFRFPSTRAAYSNNQQPSREKTNA
jgi:hypothetical protein